MNMERRGSDVRSDPMNLVLEGDLLMREGLSMKIEVKVVSEVAKDKEAASEAVKVDPIEEEAAASPPWTSLEVPQEAEANNDYDWWWYFKQNLNPIIRDV
jgi:hypothetical protein